MMKHKVIIFLLTLFFWSNSFGQPQGGWGVCEFTDLTTLVAFTPSSNLDCKKAFVQSSNEHYVWDGSNWIIELNGVMDNFYTTSDTITDNRIVVLDGNNLTFKGIEDVFIQSDGKLGIGTTSPDARLDVENGTVRFSDYGAGTITGSGTYQLSVDVDGDVVEMNTAKSSRIFYPPSLSIDVSAIASGQILDLHAEYISHYGAPAVVSSGAPAIIPNYLNSELYYYLTEFDTAVFDNVSIDSDGVMTYDVIAIPADKCAFITMVFVVK